MCRLNMPELGQSQPIILTNIDNCHLSWCLHSAKALPESMLTYRQLNPLLVEQNTCEKWKVACYLEHAPIFNQLQNSNGTCTIQALIHDDVIKCKHGNTRYWIFVMRIHRSSVDSPHKGQWRGALIFFLCLHLNKRLRKRSRRWRFDTP